MSDKMTDREYNFLRSNAVDRPPANFPNAVATNRGWYDVDTGQLVAPQAGLRNLIERFHAEQERRNKQQKKGSVSAKSETKVEDGKEDKGTEKTDDKDKKSAGTASTSTRRKSPPKKKAATKKRASSSTSKSKDE